MKIIKRISAAIFAAFIGTAFSVSAFAAPEESTVASEDSSAVSAQTSDVSAQESSNEVSSDDAEVSTDSSENSEEINYDFSDKTIGNAVLTANENIITEDGNYQFIAATTRDGNVFYIIIDKLKTTDNVYFLNQVDTYDLKALMSSEDGETVKVGENTQLFEMSETTDGESASEDTANNEDNEDESEGSDSMTTSLIMVGGLAVLGVIGFVIFKMKKGGGFGKKKPEPTILDDDFDDDDEINEDKE